MVDAARSITFATFRRNCAGVQDWARSMGYSIAGERGLHLKDDWAVSYHKSVYSGRPCYFIRHSAIEYIWT